MKMQSSNLKMRTLIYIGILPVMMFLKNQWCRFVVPVVFDGMGHLSLETYLRQPPLLSCKVIWWMYQKYRNVFVNKLQCKLCRQCAGVFFLTIWKWKQHAIFNFQTPSLLYRAQYSNSKEKKHPPVYCINTYMPPQLVVLGLNTSKLVGFHNWRPTLLRRETECIFIFIFISSPKECVVIQM